MNALIYLTPILAVWATKADRINLTDFGQVVQFSEPGNNIPKAAPLDRGTDGWEAYRAKDGQYMIGVEWDEPRDVAEANIEFRHAIANREKIKVQYYQYHKPDSGKSDEGNWTTAKVAEWWAGDRDISFTFTPLSEERPDQKGSDVTYRRTSRIRFVLGKDDLPPVRYIRVYGPNKSAEATFEVQIPADRLKPPFQVSVVNGNLIEVDEAEKRTTTRSVKFESAPLTLRISYAKGDAETPTRTQVTIGGEGDTLEPVMFSPVDVVAKGKLALDKGVVIKYRKADSPATNPTTSGTNRNRQGAE
jgi:hypothetical protein